jgi:hypothetical protein
LVTLLVGWQIYKTVDVDKRITERLREQNTKIKNAESRIEEKFNDKAGELEKSRKMLLI